MREIKFRIYSKYSDGVIAKDEVTFQEVRQGYYKEPFLAGHIAVCQYTGLKDKNGKDVYEGDIIRWDEDDGCNYELFFHDEEYRYSLRPHWVGNRCGGYVPEFKLGKIFEVIGNIYEHAELLTK